MALLQLPNELIFLIAKSLPEDRDISFFLQVNRQLADLLQDYLFQKCSSKHGESGLALCAKYGATKAAQRLLDMGVDVNRCDGDSREPWTYAAENGDFNIWRMISDYEKPHDSGPLVNRHDEFHERTPLSWAAGGGQIKFAEYLIKQGAKVNEMCLDNRTALSYAAEAGHFLMVQWLFDQDDFDFRCSLEPEDRDGFTPLHYASFEGHEDIVRELIISGADPDYCGADSLDQTTGTALMEAARGGHATIVKMFLDMGADSSDINSGNGRGMSALHYAARAGCGDIYKRTLDELFHIDDEPGPGWFFDSAGDQEPRKCGKAGDYVATVKLLLSHGADVNMQYNDHFDHSQGTALYSAAWAGSEEIVQLLIDAGADVNEKFLWGGYTPLHAAARNGHAVVAAKLIANGADVNAKDHSGHTPMDRVHWALKMMSQGQTCFKQDSGGWHWRRIRINTANVSGYPELAWILIAEGGEVGRGDDVDPW